MKIPQMVKQACATICSISDNTAASEMDAIRHLAAPAIIETVADLLASERRSDVCAAVKAVGSLARHDAIREALFNHGVISTLHRLLNSKPPISGALPMHAANLCSNGFLDFIGPIGDHTVSNDWLLCRDDIDGTTNRSAPRAVLQSTIESALTSANALSTAVVEAVAAVLHAEGRLERNAKRTEWFSARLHPTRAGLRSDRIMIGEREAMHRLAVLDSIARPFGNDHSPTLEGDSTPLSPRYDAHTRATRKLRRRERNWNGGSRCPVRREPTEPAGGAMERDKNLRIERAQRADLRLYRDLAQAAEERQKLASVRVAAARLKKRLGINTQSPQLVTKSEAARQN